MAFWRPGAPPPVPNAVPSDFDADSEVHRALPIYNSREGLPIQQQRRQLPIYKHRLELLHAIETHRAVVVCGPTGCGKSTQLPQYLDEAGWTSEGYVVGITLPRRIAAVTVAGRVAEEMGVQLGRQVGYRIRFDSNVTPGETRIEFMTEGVLLKEMLSDPLLTRYGVLVIDEAHERSSQTDLLLGLLKKIVRKRPQLRLVISSATVDVDAFLRFLRWNNRGTPVLPVRKKRPRCGWDDQSGEFHKQRAEDADWRGLCRELGEGPAGVSGGTPERDACLVDVEGRLHPVCVHYLEEPACDYVESAVGTVMAIHQQQPEGDILVFLTGQQEIEAACAMVRERLAELRERADKPSQKPKPLQAVPLHGSLPKEKQLQAFVAAPRGARKVIISTNIAEASITIEGIVYVVDACLVKLDAFCPHNGASYLNIGVCSRSAARQRAGRAGRTRPGHCYRLLTEATFTSPAVPVHTMPEIARSDMKDIVLVMKCLGIDDVTAFEFVTPPGRDAMELALEELYALGAIDDEARVIEPLGPRMAHGPLPLALMRLLFLAAEPSHACAEEAAIICSMLTLQQPFLPTTNKDRLLACRQSFAVYEGDLVMLLNIFRQYEVNRGGDQEWAKRHLLNKDLLERAMRVRRQLVLYLERMQLPVKSCEQHVEPLQRLACAALFLNAARRLPNGTYRLCRPIDEEQAPHVRFQLHPASALASVQEHEGAGFVIFAEAQCSGEQASLLHNTRIRAEWLPELAPHYFKQVAAGKALQDL